MVNRPDWDQYFMTLAYLAASRSQDTSTHAGTVIVRPDNSIVSTGYNNPVRGFDIADVPDVRPDKYHYMEHSERNAIYSAAKHEGGLQDCKLYVNFLPCSDCARAIIQSGISEVIVHKEGQEAFEQASGNTGNEWDLSHKVTLKLLTGQDECKVSIAPCNKLRWWSGKLWIPTGYFRGVEFNL